MTSIVQSRTGALVLLCLALGAAPARALPIEVAYRNSDGEGFFDPTLGAERREAFEFAVDSWARTLAGEVPIVVQARMLPLGGAGASALLASAGAVTIHRNFGGARPDTWYGAALANQIAGGDLNGGETAEISITFNEDVDGPEVLGSVSWYYGVDAEPGADIDLVTIALHEIGHGLGFFETVDPASGGWRNGADPGIFDRMLFRPGVGGFAEMLSAERLSAIVTQGRLLWDGPFVTSAAGAAPVYAPDPFVTGSSIAHWDPQLLPGELMEPSYAGPNHDPGLLLPALADMGWGIAGPSFTPGVPTGTPTPSATPSARLPPTPADEGLPVLALVTNFDSATVSVIDLPANRVTATIPVGDGPIGVTISADGSIAYVANFHGASVSVLSTIERRVVATIPVQGSANGVALTRDGSLLYVTDTFTDTVAVIDTATRRLLHTVPAPPQPAGVAAGPGGRAFVTNFGSNILSVIDPALGEVVAKIPLDEFEAHGPLGIVIAPDDGFGFVTTAYSNELLEFDAIALSRDRTDRIFSGPAEAVVLSADLTHAYLAATDSQSGNGLVRVVDLAAHEIPRSVRVGEDPEALALNPDESRLYVANTGSDTVSFFDPRMPGIVLAGSIPVGAAPMGVAVARVASTPTSTPTATPTAVTPSPCLGDCDSSGDVTLAELILAVNIALGARELNACPSLDGDDGGRVTVDELVSAAGNSLGGCDTSEDGGAALLDRDD
jgi:YVTN family beta-propeller protein